MGRPLIPLTEPDLTEAEAQAASQVIRSGFVNEGQITEQLERRFAQTVGARYAVATTNCTTALAMALMALEIKGKEVLLPDVTMIGTAMAVLLSGNIPRVVDVRRENGCIDPDEVRRAATPRTAAVIPVHLNGRDALCPELLGWARKEGIPVVEDAACCLGSSAQRDGVLVPLGTSGNLGCFSFAATKIVTSGQGGMVVTNDPGLYERCVRLKDWGRFAQKGILHPQIGFNFKFNDIHAAILLAQLDRLPDLVRRKRAVYARYRDRLGDLMFSQTDPDGFCPWYVDIRGQRLADALPEAGIDSCPIWPPLHRQPAMGMPEEGRYPCADALGSDILWLPSSTRLTDGQIDFVCDVIHRSRRDLCLPHPQPR